MPGFGPAGPVLSECLSFTNQRMKEWERRNGKVKSTLSFISQANIKNTNSQAPKFLQLPGILNLKTTPIFLFKNKKKIQNP